jgi:uncharacterized membrane protein HdeD (DUF308 family)
MNAIPVPIIVKESLGWSIALSILMILAGTLAVVLPFAAAIAANILLGWLLVFSGGAHLAFAWHSRRNRGFIWELILSLVYIVIGAYLLLNPVISLIPLALALAIYLFAEGLVELILSFRLRPATGSGWLLFDGIVTLVLAVMIGTQWPWGSAWVIGTLVGVSMVFSGLSRLMVSLAARRITMSLA